MLKKFINIVPALTSLVFLASCHAEAISPFSLPLKSGLFQAKNNNFGARL
mgnify:FL=1